MAANSKLIILVMLISLLPHIIFTSTSAKGVDTKAYVDSWCKATKYQNRCVRSLTPYVLYSRATQSPEELVLFVLKESLNLAKNTKASLLKEVANREKQSIKDYVSGRVSMSLLIDILTRLINLLTRAVDGGVGVKYGNNLQRWTSTALTDAETLVSKFQGRRPSKLEATIQEKVKNLEETTSNAVAITKHYAAARH